MHAVTHHEIPGAPGATVTAIDQPDPQAGNACHQYVIEHGRARTFLSFQHGPIGEHGRNGAPDVAVASVLLDRARAFAASWPGADNEAAVKGLEDYIAATTARTRARIAAGVEGTNAKTASEAAGV